MLPDRGQWNRLICVVSLSFFRDPALTRASHSPQIFATTKKPAKRAQPDLSLFRGQAETFENARVQEMKSNVFFQP